MEIARCKPTPSSVAGDGPLRPCHLFTPVEIQPRAAWRRARGGLLTFRGEAIAHPWCSSERNVRKGLDLFFYAQQESYLNLVHNPVAGIRFS